MFSRKRNRPPQRDAGEGLRAVKPRGVAPPDGTPPGAPPPASSVDPWFNHFTHPEASTQAGNSHSYALASGSGNQATPAGTNPIPDYMHMSRVTDSGDPTQPAFAPPGHQPTLSATDSAFSMGSLHTSVPRSGPGTNSPKSVQRRGWRYLEDFRHVLSGISGGLGPLAPVMDKLSDLIEVYEHAIGARDDYATLKNELEGLFSVLSSHFSDRVPPTMTAGMNNICIAIDVELERIAEKEGRGAARRHFEANRDVEDAMECCRHIKGHLERLKLNANLSTWRIVDEQAAERRLQSLTPSMSACYNSAEAFQIGRRECTPETRKEVLTNLSHWRREKGQENIYWLSGMAGTGKTTIASSLCAMLDQSHELGASFFCTRLLPECRNAKLILPTVAYQLARFSHPFYHALSVALQADPDLHTKALPIQLQGLIVDPLRKAAPALPEHLVIVIDALDECEDGHAVGLLLEVIAKRATDLPLKVFVSSRPEPQIREKIGETKFKLILHELEALIVKEDIRLYLQTELLDMSTAASEVELAGLVERAGVLFIYAATVVRYIKSVSSSSRRQRRLREVLEVKRSGLARTNNDIDALYSTILASAFTSAELNDEERETMKLVVDTIVCAQEPLTVPTLAGLLRLEGTSSVEDALEPLWSLLHISKTSKLVTTLHASFPDYMLDPTRSKHHTCRGDKHHGRLAELCFDRIDRNECQFNICGLESSYVFDEDVPDLGERVQAMIPPDLWYACRYWAAHLKQGGTSTERLHRVMKFVGDRLLLWMEVLNLKKQINVGAPMFETVEQWCKEGNAPQETRDLIHDAWRFITMFATNDVSRSTTHLYISMLASWSESGPGIAPYMQRIDGPATVGGSGIGSRQPALLGVFSAEDSVNSLAFSPDGMRIVSGSFDKTVRVWDVQAGKALLDPLRGHTRFVNSVAFSPDGMRIVSGSDDKTVRMWDAQTSKPLLDPLRGHAESVNSVAFSPDGIRIVSSSKDSTIRVWDAQTGQALPDPLRGHIESVNSVAFSPDSTRIVSGSHDKTIRVWDVQTGKALFDPLRGHTGLVMSVAFSPDGTRIVSGSSDRTIWIWDAQTGKALLDPLRGHAGLITSVAFLPEGRRIISGSYDHTVRVWDAQTGKALLEPLRGHTGSVNSVAFSPDGMRIVSGSDDETIRVWDARAGKVLLHPLRRPTLTVTSVKFSLDAIRIISGFHDQATRVWDVQTIKALLDPLPGFTCFPNLIAFSPDGMCIVSGLPNNAIWVLDAQTGKALLDPLRGHNGSVMSVAFSPDGMRIASGSGDKTIRVWDAQTGKTLLDPLKGHTESVNSVAFSPDGMCIVSGSYDQTVRVWDVQTGKELLDPLSGHTGSVNTVSFSPDGMRIVSGSDDETIRLWDAQTGEALLNPFEGHTNSVKWVAFSPDGMKIVSGSSDKTIRMWNLDGLMVQESADGYGSKLASNRQLALPISGSWDRTIRVWEAQTGQLLLDTLTGHIGSVESAAFWPNGKLIPSGSRDTTTRLWDAQTGEPLLGPLWGHTDLVSSVAFLPVSERPQF